MMTLRGVDLGKLIWTMLSSYLGSVSASYIVKNRQNIGVNAVLGRKGIQGLKNAHEFSPMTVLILKSRPDMQFARITVE